jgi:hypothetical protein
MRGNIQKKLILDMVKDKLLFQANMTSSQISSLVTTYILAIREFGDEYLFDCLKNNYSDVCSQGDVVINRIIDILYQERRKSPQQLCELLAMIQDVGRFAYHVEATMKEWIEDKECKPDAWWAS